MKKICQKCKHWTAPDPAYRDQVGGRCDNDAFVFTGAPENNTPVNGLGYADYDGYSAAFTTGPEFGCIHWSKKVSADRGVKHHMEEVSSAPQELITLEFMRWMLAELQRQQTNDIHCNNGNKEKYYQLRINETAEAITTLDPQGGR